jgi:hypothetical protein
VQVVFVFERSQGEAHSGSVNSADVHDVEVLILHPEAAPESRSAYFLRRSYIKNKTAHFSQELLSDIVELVMGLVELPSVDINHLQESRGVIRPSQGTLLPALDGRMNFEPFLEIGLTQEVDVVLRHDARPLVQFHFLDLHFNDRRKALDGFDILALLRDHALHNLFHLARRRCSFRIGDTSH